MRSFAEMSGAAAWGTASVASILKCSSGMGRLPYFDTSRLQAGKEAMDFLPDFRPAGEPTPVGADQPYQPITLIYGNDVIFRRRAHAVDQKSFDIRLHLLQRGMLSRNVRPGFEAEQRFDRTSGAGIHRPDLVRCTVAIEKCKIDGNHQRLPL